MNIGEQIRLQGRTYEQFARDIKQAHMYEKDIIQRYIKRIKTVEDVHLKYKNNGADNSGKFLSYNQVNSKADYILIYPNGREKLVEVKMIEQSLDFFRLKATLVKSYIRQQAHILLVNGYHTNNPIYTLLTPVQLKKLLKHGNVYTYPKWEDKKVVDVYTNDYCWQNLNEINTN